MTFFVTGVAVGCIFMAGLVVSLLWAWPPDDPEDYHIKRGMELDQ